MACKKYRNKAGITTQGDYLATKNHGKERLEDYFTLLDDNVSDVE